MCDNKSVLEKAERILISNIYTQKGYLWDGYRMITPGKGKFKGIWNWDTAFHALGMIDFDKEIAKEQILGFLSFQKENGLLPDVIWENNGIEDHFTKPPVMAYAACEVFKATNDLEFLKAVYPKLVLNEEFWVKNRKYKDLFHYDADKSNEERYLVWVGYESGWDNSPRWDNEPQNCWAIDLNCFMVLTYRSLSYMADVLGYNKCQWDQKEKELCENIEKHLWNEKLNSYTDYNFKSEKHINVLTPASFMPLFSKVASNERAKLMNDIAVKHFLPGMPTVSYNDASYGRDYWRGPTWLNVAYFATKGLYDYGFVDTANIIRSQIIQWVADDGDCVHENYDSKTGEGLCCDHFSWSCVFIRKFILDF